MIYSINFAEGQVYKKIQSKNTKSAYRKGKVDKVIEYSLSDIDSEYRIKHQDIFRYKRGAGLWLWKPYIILNALSMMKEGDWLFYCDSGAIFIDKVQHLIDCAIDQKQSILLFELPLKNRQWTKKETYMMMGFEDFDENQILGSYILLKNEKKNIDFIREWQYYMEQEELLSPEHFYPNILENDNFIAHREDQSILTLLRIKYNLPAYRDPSDYGIMPYMYFSHERLYEPQKYETSNYPVILLCVRSSNYLIYKLKFYLKPYLCKMGLYNKTI